MSISKSNWYFYYNELTVRYIASKIGKYEKNKEISE